MSSVLPSLFKGISFFNDSFASWSKNSVISVSIKPGAIEFTLIFLEPNSFASDFVKPPKAALGGFTKSLAKELGSRNINVNSIAPGFIDTDMTEFLDHEAKELLKKDIPLNRLGNTDDISELAFFLASDQAQYITGQTISVDGGLFMH